jgi:hypothetical protein
MSVGGCIPIAFKARRRDRRDCRKFEAFQYPMGLISVSCSYQQVAGRASSHPRSSFVAYFDEF